MTFDEWFQSKQGEPYDSMYVFARDAWNAALGQQREECALMCEKEAGEWEKHGNETAEDRDDEIMSQARCDELRDMAEAMRSRSNAKLTCPHDVDEQNR